ncbi:MAG: hypothetical protein IPI69_15700 [Bacteroidales bacterium]|nr:hypothetical protein [Bacteroidales bacterium]
MIEPAFIEGYMLLPSALVPDGLSFGKKHESDFHENPLESLSLVIPEDVFYHAPVGSE